MNQQQQQTSGNSPAVAAGGVLATHALPQLPPTPTKMNNSTSLTAQQQQGQFDLKKLLPIAAFFMGFATVMTLLLIYMDHKALRHHQFNVNMTQDYELLGVEQDNPELVSAIKEYFLKPAVEPHHKSIEYTAEFPPQDVEFVLKLLNNKEHGNFVEAGAYGDGKTSETEWLEKKLSWKGLLVQPDPRHYFSLKRHNRAKSEVLHGCLSPTPYPKEVTYHQEERDGVKINCIHPYINNLIDDPDLFNTRVKCFPLYSLLLAMNMTRIDYLILESRGTELQVLETVPFEKVEIGIIDVHLLISEKEKDTIKKFLAMKNYTLVQNFNSSYIYKSNKLK